MAELLWKLPVPATGLLESPRFEQLPQHECELSMRLEDPDSGKAVQVSLRLEGVEAYRCTYLPALSAEMINTAYGRLINLGATSWLKEISNQVHAYWAERKRSPHTLSHLMICFDDGPCYEFICSSFRTNSPN